MHAISSTPPRLPKNDPAALNAAIRRQARARARFLLSSDAAPLPKGDEGKAPRRQAVTISPLLDWLDEKRIRQEDYDASVQIAFGWRVKTLGLDPSIAMYGERIPGGDGSVPTEMAVIAERQYDMWAREVQRREAAANAARKKGFRKSRLAAIQDVIVHEMSCFAAERRHRLSNGCLFEEVKAALEVYVELSYGRRKADREARKRAA